MRWRSISCSAPNSVASRSRGSSQRGGYCLSAKARSPLRTRQMRLLRPPVLKRLTSTAPPTSAPATSVACKREPSSSLKSCSAKNLLLNLTPSGTGDIGSPLWLHFAGEQDAFDIRREVGISQNLLEIVDEG